MQHRKPEQKLMFRSFELNRSSIDTERRTVELAFSSETDEVERWDGIEILDHSSSSIRLGRLENGAPLLVNHDWSDHIGVVEGVTVGADRKARAVVRFGKSARADEIYNDVVDGIRTKVSVGYMIHRREETDEGTDKKPVFRVVDWEPYEISIVSVPADDSVGVGREMNLEPEPEPEKEERSMSDDTNTKNTPDPEPVNIEAERAAIRDAEIKRINEITAIAQRRGMNEAAEQFIRDGKSVDQFRAYVLDQIETDDTAAESTTRHASVDMSAPEERQYSVVRAMAAAASGDWSKAGLEREVSEDIARQLGRETNGVYVPTNLRHTPEMMQRMAELGERAPLQTGVPASGGYTVETSVMTLIEMLRNRMMVRRMGARVLSGLEGNLSFPRQASGSAFTWTSEVPGTDVADSDATYDQVNLSPKSGQSSTSYSRQMLAQSSLDVEMFVRDDLTLAAALGIDLAAIAGTGSANQPTGILNTTGIGSVSGGANGAAPTWDHIVKLESAVAAANADLRTLGYLTNAAVRGKLKTTPKDAGSGLFVWETGAEGFGDLNGYRAGVSNQVPGNLTKGTGTNLSAIIFGNWDDLMIGEWGAMEILVDPYAKKKRGLIEVTSFVMADIAIRHPESFSAMVDAITA